MRDDERDVQFIFVVSGHETSFARPGRVLRSRNFKSIRILAVFSESVCRPKVVQRLPTQGRELAGRLSPQQYEARLFSMQKRAMVGTLRYSLGTLRYSLGTIRWMLR